ncbi:MAG: hypothetical protein GQ533_09945 [Methanosarcinaceae archaeon]|nr:hypothetical protein [Methanosarcinaceae archaeon]
MSYRTRAAILSLWGYDRWGGTIWKTTEDTEGTEVDVRGLIGEGACRAACFETFIKSTESSHVDDVKQSEA